MGNKWKNTYKKPAPNAGRKKGVKNLKRTTDANGVEGFLNQNNVFISAAEKKELERLVRKSNQRQQKLREIFDPLPYKIEGKETGMSVGERRLTLGAELDFSITDKNASVQRYESRKEFESYMRNLRRVTQDNYIEERARQFKRNYQKALTDPIDGLGLPYDQVSDILMKIRTMKPEQYLKEYASNEELEVGYIYDKTIPLEIKLNSIRAALGLKPREYDHFWEGDEF